MDSVKEFFQSKGTDLNTKTVGKALVIHEILGLTVLVSAWAACWAVKPSKHFLNILQVKKTAQWRKAQERMQDSKLLKRVRESRYVSSKTGSELAIAFGESYFLRKLGLPVLVPLKLWLTYELVVAGERREEDMKG